ncbi:thiamine pyrophosphate-binding protein [Bordetella pertussis]|uniref:thiamine pyrophosphate-binding protein n=1 Tax=Bordetella pertussis TaxID=520 RepID=UPI00202A1234|nr:thiamine pyrophosphate-binding protein [Bordetella pertussis]
MHIAKQDSTPMILFVGQIERGMREREAFQEMDYRAVFGTQAKWVTEIDQVERIPELISRAFHVATSGRPGRWSSRCPRTSWSKPPACPMRAL